MTYLQKAKSLYDTIIEMLIHEKPIPLEIVDEYNHIMDSVLNLEEHRWDDKYMGGIRLNLRAGTKE